MPRVIHQNPIACAECGMDYGHTAECDSHDDRTCGYCEVNAYDCETCSHCKGSGERPTGEYCLECSGHGYWGYSW